MKLLTILCLALSLTANASASVVDVPNDTETYLYGLGIDIDYAGARKLSLADITQKLSSRIESSSIIESHKHNQRSSVTVKSTTIATTHAIELPSVKIIESIQESGQWWIVTRVERALVQMALAQQLSNLSSDLSLLIEDYASSPGPACWFALTSNLAHKKQLQNLLPAYVGSGVEVSKTDVFNRQLVQFEKLYQRCQQRNRFRLSVSKDPRGEFKLAFKRSLAKSGLKVTHIKKNTGLIKVNLDNNYRYIYSNHMVMVTASISIFDELGNLISQKSFKTKGVSLSSHKNASKQAIKNVIKKINQLTYFS